MTKSKRIIVKNKIYKILFQNKTNNQINLINNKLKNLKFKVKLQANKLIKVLMLMNNILKNQKKIKRILKKVLKIQPLIK